MISKHYLPAILDYDIGAKIVKGNFYKFLSKYLFTVRIIWNVPRNPINEKYVIIYVRCMIFSTLDFINKGRFFFFLLRMSFNIYKFDGCTVENYLWILLENWKFRFQDIRIKWNFPKISYQRKVCHNPCQMHDFFSPCLNKQRKYFFFIWECHWISKSFMDEQSKIIFEFCLKNLKFRFQDIRIDIFFINKCYCRYFSYWKLYI